MEARHDQARLTGLARVGVAVLVTLTACRDRAQPPPAAPTVAVTISVDGVTVARLAGAELAARRPLVELVPADARDVAGWTEVAAATADGRALRIPDPARRFADQDAVLYVDGGALALGLFRRAHPDQPAHVRQALAQPTVVLVGVTTIAITTDDGAAAPPGTPPPPAPGLTVVIAGAAPVELTADRLAALPALPGGHKRGGWNLTDVLDAAGSRGAATITAVGREGSATFTRAEAEAPGVRATVRRNRRGELRVALERAGADAGQGVVVHDVTRLEIR